MTEKTGGIVRAEELRKLEPHALTLLLRNGRITRRDLLGAMGGLGLSTLGRPFAGLQASAANELNLIVFEGYTSDGFVSPFETANDQRVAATYANRSDQMFSLLDGSGGENIDEVSATSDVTALLVERGLLAEIDVSKLTNYNKLWNQFKTLPFTSSDSKLYGVNFAWSPMLLTCNPRAIASAPTSWNAMIDRQYSGKIATWNYPIQIAQYALLLDPPPADPFDLTDEHLARVKDILIAQKPHVRKYWDYGQEVSELFLNGEIVIAEALPWIAVQARDGGVDLQGIFPEEGVTGWSDAWCISSRSENYELALKWADWMISDESQILLTELMNYSITNKSAAASLPLERQQELRLTNVEEDFKKIHLWRNIPAFLGKWVPIWNEATGVNMNFEAPISWSPQE